MFGSNDMDCARENEAGLSKVSRRRVIGAGVGVAGISALALPASAAFNSYLGPTSASGELFLGESFYFGQVSGTQVRMTWARQDGSSTPESFTVDVEAYYIPPGGPVPAVNPYRVGTFPTVPYTTTPWNTGSVIWIVEQAETMYGTSVNWEDLVGTRFRAVFKSMDSPARTVTVPLDGYGPGDRWGLN